MKKFSIGLWLLLVLPAMAIAQSPFDGTWVADLNTAKLSQKPEIFLLNQGMYSCVTCVPKIKVKADGQDQKVTGSHYLDSAAIRVVDANTIEEIDKKDGKVVYRSTSTVSADGKSLSTKFEESFEAAPVTGEENYTRVSRGPAGSHAVSGSWRAEKFSNISSNGISVTYESTPDGMKMSDNNGEGYDAKFDGKKYPLQNDPGHTLVSIKKLGTHTLMETYTRDGKVISTFTMTISADGKVMHAVANDLEQGRINQFTLNKKS
jgi:hypothetical protein